MGGNVGDLSAGLGFVAAAAQFTRPADTTTYASGDLVANNTVAGSVTPLTFKAVAKDFRRSVTLLRCRVRKSGTTVAAANLRLHLFRTLPATFTGGDNAALVCDQAAGYMGSMDITQWQAFSDGAVGVGAPTTGSSIVSLPTSGTSMDLYGVLEARGAHPAASAETYDVSLEGYRD